MSELTLPKDSTVSPIANVAEDEWHQTAGFLEKIVKQNPDLFSDPLEWIRGMLGASFTVCRIENPEGTAWGTGFLIGPDLVITNHHVACDSAFTKTLDKVRCRFGFQTKTDGLNAQGKTYSLTAHSKCLQAEDAALDYAILRLGANAGLDRIDESPNAPRRGWVRIAGKAPVIGQSLFILQHPSGEPLKMADGGLRNITPPWLSYDPNTEYGSSGSPVFNNKWQLVALHSRRELSEPLNKGILFAAILDHLPAAIGNEVRASVPPPLAEVTKELLEIHNLSSSKVEKELVEVHLSKLGINAVKLLVTAILDLARKWTGRNSSEGICDIGGGHQLQFGLNTLAITQPGFVHALRGTLELIVANESGIRSKERAAASGAHPAVDWDGLIEEQRGKLTANKIELNDQLASILVFLRSSKNSENTTQS